MTNLLTLRLSIFFPKIPPDHARHLWTRKLQLSATNHSLSPTPSSPRMKYFVIGVSGVTCGGKTTLVQLLQRSFPWSKVFYQDAYFLHDDDPRHIRLPHVQNHVNYEIPESLDNDRMHADFLNLFNESRDSDNGNNGPCNFETTGKELVEAVKDIGFDTSKYRNVPILLVEGFIIFGSNIINDKCDVKLFVTLDKAECWNRRSKRTTYVPPDVPGYFDECVWPEFEKHYNNCIANQSDINIFDGNTSIESVWEKSLILITQAMKLKCSHLLL